MRATECGRVPGATALSETSRCLPRLPPGTSPSWAQPGSGRSMVSALASFFIVAAHQSLVANMWLVNLCYLFEKFQPTPCQVYIYCPYPYTSHGSVPHNQNMFFQAIFASRMGESCLWCVRYWYGIYPTMIDAWYDIYSMIDACRIGRVMFRPWERRFFRDVL